MYNQLSKLSTQFTKHILLYLTDDCSVCFASTTRKFLLIWRHQSRLPSLIVLPTKWSRTFLAQKTSLKNANNRHSRTNFKKDVKFASDHFHGSRAFHGHRSSCSHNNHGGKRVIWTHFTTPMTCMKSLKQHTNVWWWSWHQSSSMYYTSCESPFQNPASLKLSGKCIGTAPRGQKLNAARYLLSITQLNKIKLAFQMKKR